MTLEQPIYYILMLLTVIAFYGFKNYKKLVLIISGLVFLAYFVNSSTEFFFILAPIFLTFCSLKFPTRFSLWMIIFFLIISLFMFKINGPFVRWFQDVHGTIIPLGFSYLIFELISYRLDSSKRKNFDQSFTSFLSYSLFFPCRTAGPIKRFDAFNKEVLNSTFDWANISYGLFRIIIGFAKKFILADAFHLFVNQFAVDNAVGLFPIFSYSFYIYFDFSAYSDIAIGSSRLLGIKVSENFNNPYLKTNIRDFWNAWHISLTSWLRDYVFMFFGKELLRTKLKNTPLIAATFNYLITFLICGAWHGVSAHFLLWGLYNGALISFHHIYRQLMPSKILKSNFYNSYFSKSVFTVITFLAVTFGWILFAYDLDRVKFLIEGIL